ncbi:MAG: porin family protein [Christiangramia sp.]
MFRKYFLITAFAILSFSTYAQNLSFGAKAGVNFSDLYSSDLPVEDLTKMKTGIHLGVVAEYMLKEQYGLQVELLYSQQGTKTFYQDIDQPGPINGQPTPGRKFEIKSNYDYLNLPVFAKFYIYKGLHIMAGPQVSYLISAKDKYPGENINVEEEIDSFDFGLNGGLGYKFDFGLSLNANYYLGLNNISAINYEDVYGFDPDLKQEAFQFSVVYFF